MSDAESMVVTVSFCLGDDILDEELELIEENLGELLKQTVFLVDIEE